MALFGLLSLIGLLCSLFLETSNAVTFDRADYRVCNESAQQNDGFSSVEFNGISYWTHCGFPNPLYNIELCGRSPFGVERDYLLCDPDSVFTAYATDTLDESLWTLSDKTPYQCKTLMEVRMNFTVVLVAVQNLRTVNLSASTDVCINDCYEVQPVLDPTARNTTDEERQISLQSFAQGLVDDWEIAFCNNSVVVVYWAEYKLIATAPGRRASKYLTPEKITRVQDEALRLIGEAQLLAGLEYLIEEYQTILIGFSPAFILLAIYGGCLILVALFLLAVFGFGKSTVGGYWEEGKAKLALKKTLKILCGVWLVEHLILTLIKLEMKARFWWTIVPFAGFVGCLIGAIIVSQLEDNQVTNSTILL